MSIDREEAQRLRREWMTLLGCDEKEIAEACDWPRCCNPEQERIQLEAARRIRDRNARRQA